MARSSTGSPFHSDHAGVFGEEAEQDAEQGGLAGADASGHDGEGSARDVEGYVVDSPAVVAVAVGEALGLDQVESVGVRLGGEWHVGQVTREIGALMLDEAARGTR